MLYFYYPIIHMYIIILFIFNKHNLNTMKLDIDISKKSQIQFNKYEKRGILKSQNRIYIYNVIKKGNILLWIFIIYIIQLY